MHQQLWGYKVEDKLRLGVRERKRLNTTALDNCYYRPQLDWKVFIVAVNPAFFLRSKIVVGDSML